MYVPFADVLIVTGLQVPVILLLDVVGNAGAVDPWQSGPIAVNVGIIDVLITTSMVVVAAH